MKSILRFLTIGLLMTLFCSGAYADEYSDTKKMFEGAGIANMFSNAYGYALFPTIGKAGFVVGGAYGKGRVYEQGKHIGDTEMIQATVGFQLGGAG
jgi:lipid-binding SYLF domain-containing protein